MLIIYHVIYQPIYNEIINEITNMAEGFTPNFVDWNFIGEREGWSKKGYVPKDRKGKVLDKSGVTVGSGVDLGAKNKEYFKGLDKKLLDKIWRGFNNATLINSYGPTETTVATCFAYCTKEMLNDSDGI